MIGRLAGAFSVAILAIAAGCGEDVRRVELVLVRHPDGCDQVPVDDTTTYKITAFGESPEEELNFGPGAPVDIDSFPPDTHQLGLSIRTGDLGVAGKTAPFAFDSLPPTVPVSIGPPEGLCALGPLRHARRGAKVIASGAGAIVVGGSSWDGTQLEPRQEIEYFDPTTNTFIDLYAEIGFDVGMRGGSMLALTDGRVVYVSGGDRAYGVFDPVANRFVRDIGLPQPQMLAAAVALDDHRFAIAGGCTALDPLVEHRCAPGTTIAAVRIIDVDAQTETEAPSLPVARADATATLQFRAGAAMLAVAGGVDGTGAPLTTIDFVPVAGGVVETIAGGAGTAAPLDAGGLLTAFATPGAPASADAGVAVADSSTVWPTDAPPPPLRSDTVLIPLENGTVLAIGGQDDGGQPAVPVVFEPLEGWRELVDTAAPILVDHAAARLADGSVLVVGGHDGTTDLATAWRFRPSLIGPFSGSAAIDFNLIGIVFELTARDPALVTRTGNYSLRTVGATDNFALLSGPRLAHGTLTAELAIVAGSLALIAQSTGPGDRIEAVLQPNVGARVDRVAGGVRTTLCTDPAFIPAGTATFEVTLTISGHRLVVQRTGTDAPDIDCDTQDEAPPAGLWGLAAIGDGAQIDLESIAVDR